MIAAILTGFLVFCAIVGALLLAKWYVNRRIAVLTYDWFVPQVEGQPHKAAQLIDVVAERFASKILFILKQSAQGSASGEARQERALNAAVTQDLIAAQNPLLGILSQLPQTQKLLKKNPQIAEMFLARMMQAKGGMPMGGNTGKSESMTQMNFNL